MFRKAGHVMSYREINKHDTALAKKTWMTMVLLSPKNLVKGRFVHFSTDNVDINEYTLEEKEHLMPHKWLPGNADHLKVISSLE